MAVVTNAGGPGVLVADVIDQEKLELARFTPDILRKLREMLPSTAAVANPVDVIGDATSERYKSAVSIVMNDPNVDSICVLLTPQAMTDTENIAQSICELSKSTEKPFVTCFMGGKMVKDVTGYNLKKLMVGSEGTLGIITKVFIKLLPLPKAKVDLLALFPSQYSRSNA